MENPFRRLSKAPTNPVHHSHAARTGGLGGSSAEAGGSGDPQISPSAAKRKAFDVEDLYRGPLLDVSEDSGELDLDEKLRQAYFWIVNTAIISPHYDIEFHDGPSAEFQLGDSKARLTLPSGQSYSSFVLLPLLTFATRTKCLFIGGTGRGKTALDRRDRRRSSLSTAKNSDKLRRRWDRGPNPCSKFRRSSALLVQKGDLGTDATVGFALIGDRNSEVLGACGESSSVGDRSKLFCCAGSNLGTTRIATFHEWAEQRCDDAYC